MSPFSSSCRGLAALLLSASLLATAHAHGDGASAVSAISAVPIAVSADLASGVMSGAAELSVAAVEASTGGVVWVVERASDGGRSSVRIAGQTAGLASVAVGSVLTVTVIATGCVLSAAGQALAFVPNTVGAALLHQERVSP